MKRKFNLLLIVTPLLLALLIILPAGLAQRRSGPSGPIRAGSETRGKTTKKNKSSKNEAAIKPQVQAVRRSAALQRTLAQELRPTSAQAVALQCHSGCPRPASER